LFYWRRAAKNSKPSSIIDLLRRAAVAVITAGLDQQPVTASHGPGTAMDFALTLIEILAGAEKRHEVEKGLVR